MFGTLGELSEFNVDSLRRNHFCMGVKRGKRYRCGGEAGEEEKSKAIELLAEAVRRVWRWHVWEAWWVVEWMDEWLEKRDRLETQLRGKYSEEVVNAITGLVDKFINYNEQFLNYWQTVGGEAKKLVDDLLSGRAEVVIRGEDASGISVHEEHVTLEVDRAKAGGITVHLKLKGLEGVTIKVPNIFKRTMSEREYKKFVKRILKMMRSGLEKSDGYIESGKSSMNTTQVWQVITWSLLYFGRMRVHINSINVNEGDVTITWHLKSSHDPLKGKILSDVNRLGEEEILAFTLAVVLGDGNAYVKKDIKKGRIYNEPKIRVVMSSEELNAWGPLLERLRSMGFRSGKPETKNINNVIKIPFYGSNAINLAMVMISVLPPILRDVLNALGFEKWLNLRQIAEMEMKRRRGEMVNVAGYNFTVNARTNTVELIHWAKDDTEIDEIISALRAEYGDEFAVNTHKSGKYRAVVIPARMIERYDDIKAQVIEVLCKKLKRTKDERKRQIIIKHLRRLAPTKGAAAAGHTN